LIYELGGHDSIFYVKNQRIKRKTTGNNSKTENRKKAGK
jgi:hypothetical protein